MKDQPRTRVDTTPPKRKKEKYPLPSRGEVVSLAMRIYDEALENTKHRKDENEQIQELSDPDYKAATEALKLVTKICGYDGNPPSDEEMELEAEDFLERLAAQKEAKA